MSTFGGRNLSKMTQPTTYRTLFLKLYLTNFPTGSVAQILIANIEGVPPFLMAPISTKPLPLPLFKRIAQPLVMRRV